MADQAIRLSIGSDDQPDDWVTVNPSGSQPEPNDWQTISAPQVPSQPAEPGLLEQWNNLWINRPLSYHLTGGESVAPKVSQYFDDPAARTEDQWKIPEAVPFIGGGTFRSLFSGMGEGLVNVGESLTTPLNVATAGAAGTYSRAAKTATTLPGLTEAAYTTAPKVAEAARRTTQALSAPLLATGGARVAEGIRTGNWQDVPIGAAEAAAGVIGLRLPRTVPPRPRQAAAPIEAPAVTPEVSPVIPQEPAPIEAPVVEPPTPEPQAVFDPNTLVGLRRSTGAAGQTMHWTGNRRSPGTGRPEMQFISPETGQIKPASQAVPGDVPLIPQRPAEPTSVSNQQMFELSRQIDAENRPTPPVEEQLLPHEFSPDVAQLNEQVLGGTSPRFESALPVKRPSFAESVKNFMREESGEFNADFWRDWGRRRADESSENYRRRIQNQIDEAEGYDFQTPSIRGPIDEMIRGARAKLQTDPNAEVQPSSQAAVSESIGATPREPLTNESTQSIGRRVVIDGDTSGREFVIERTETVQGEEWADLIPLTSDGNLTNHRVREPLYNLEALSGPRSLDSYPRDPYFRPMRQEEPTTSHTGGPEDFTNIDRPLTLSESYQGIAQQVRGMTIREADNFIRGMANDLYAEDIAPIREALSVNPNTATRTAIIRLNAIERDIAARVYSPPPELRIPEPVVRRLDGMSDARLDRYIIRNENSRFEHVRNQVSYARQILEERLAAREQGVRIPEEPRPDYNIDDITNENMDIVRGRIRNSSDQQVQEFINQLDNIRNYQNNNILTSAQVDAYNYAQETLAGRQTGNQGFYDPYSTPRGKTLAEVEAAKNKKTPKSERLAKIVGEDIAQELRSGTREILFNESARESASSPKRFTRGERESWNRWSQSELSYQLTDPSKPGLTVETGAELGSTWAPNSFKIVYRNAEGVPLGVLESNSDGTGITTFAISNTTGLGRGAIWRKMLREAWKRGTNEPSGSTSMNTKNFIERIKALASDESGEFNPSAIFGDGFERFVERVSQLVGRTSAAASKFVKEVTGEVDTFFRSDKGEFDLSKFGRGRGVAKFEGKQSPEAREFKPGELVRHPEHGVGRVSVMPEELQSMTTQELDLYAYRIKTKPWKPEHDNAMLAEIKAEFDRRNAERRAGRWGAVTEFMRNESGEIDIGRLQALFNKKESGTITPSEVAEFDQLAQRLRSEKSRTQNYQTYMRGAPQVSTGPLDPANVRPAENLGNRIRSMYAQGSTATGGGQPPAARTPRTRTGGGGRPPRPPMLNADQIDPNIPIQKRKPLPALEQSKFGQLWNAPRSMQSVDLPGITSAALRQSRPLAFTSDWFRAWGTAVKAFGDKAALDAVNNKISNSKYFRPRYQPVVNRAGEVVKYIEKPSIAEELGVKMTDVINTREEAIVSSLAEKIPGYGRYVTASNRAYTAFLNDLRAAKFEQLMDGAKAKGRNPEVDQVLGRKLADYVNNATGRGSLKYFGEKLNLEPLAAELGYALYSPRALSARLSFMNPYNYTMQDAFVRTEYWKSLARIGASWGAFTGLGSLLPSAHVSLDPNNADFGKIRIGNTRIDPGGGWQQLMVLTHRMLPQVLGGGGTVSSTGRPGMPGKFTPFGSSPMAATRLSLPGRYLYNQLNPSLRFITDMLNATQRDPIDLTDRVIQLALPMYATDIAEAAKGDPIVAEFFAPLLSSMGAGVQTYDKPSKGGFNKPVVTPAIEELTGIDVPTIKVGR